MNIVQVEEFKFRSFWIVRRSMNTIYHAETEINDNLCPMQLLPSNDCTKVLVNYRLAMDWAMSTDNGYPRSSLIASNFMPRCKYFSKPVHRTFLGTDHRYLSLLFWFCTIRLKKSMHNLNVMDVENLLGTTGGVFMKR